jgi:amino acid adenylation domain-containing protein
MVPSVLVEMESIPLTANGKADRKALPDPDATEVPADQYVAPRNDAEARLARIWQDVLEEEQVGVHDDFFELGGHSLLAVRLISAIRKEFTVEIPISHVFDYPTIALLAAELDQKPEAAVLPSIEVIRPRPEYIPLSFSQERLWFIDRMEGSVQYHVPAVLSLKGELNIEALAYALRTIVNRHEVLRTVILEKDGQPYQLIKDQDEWELRFSDASKYRKDEEGLKQYIKEAIKVPFDLSKDYMLRAELLSLREDDHVLVVTLHHIASDGWSTSILVGEVVELYNSWDQQRASSLGSLNVQYADFSIWQRNYLQAEVLDKKLGYWKKKLHEVTPMQLPTDFVRPAVQSTRGSSTSFTVDKQLSEQLHQLSKQQNVTLFMLMLAACKVLLYRYTGQQDIAVGTGVAGRHQKDLEQLIGFFVNTLVLRSEVNGGSSFTGLLQQVKATAMEAFENQEVPFEKVVETVVRDRDLSRSPLFQVMFVMRNTPDVPELYLGKTKLSGKTLEHTTTLFDLTFFVTETTGGLHIAIDYRTDLFTADTVKRIGKGFIELLNSIVKKPDDRIAKLKVLTSDEEHKLLVKFNDTSKNYDQNKSLVDLFEEQVIKTPGNIALVFEGGQVTYQQLNERCNQLAHLLRSQGVKEETLVPICAERSVELVVGVLGILKAGGAYVPIDPNYPADRINYMIRDTGASTVVTSKDIELQLEGLENVVRLDSQFTVLDAFPDENPIKKLNPDNLAYVIYTSGSTGTPKGVVVAHSAVVNLATWHIEEFELTSHSKSTTMAGVGFDAFGWEIFPYLLRGASVYIVDDNKRLLIKELVRLFASERITHSFLSTALVGDFVKESKDVIPTLKYLLTGGDKLAAVDLSGINYTIVNNYGPTENTVVATSYKLTSKDNAVIPPIGAPVSNTRIYITGNDLELCPPGVFGEICISGNGLARGYLNLPQLTNEKFVSNPFDGEKHSKIYKTGDVGRWLADGNIEYLGRKDKQLKIRGHRVETGEIESVVLQSGMVKQVLVVSKEDKTGNNNLVGYLVTHEAFSKEALISYVRAKVPNFMVPAFWIPMDGFPLTENGKIDTKALPEPETNGQRKEYVAATNEVEENLVEIWQNLLQVERVGIEDNFFELGGHSLLVMRMVSAIERDLFISIPISVLFQFTTIKDLSKYLQLQTDTSTKEKNTAGFELLDV